MSKMQSNQLKWMDLHPQKRHFIIGSIIDGMVYHPECVEDVLDFLYEWNKKGMLKSIILPGEENYFSEEKIEEEHNEDAFCSSCNGTGEGSTPDSWCWKCKGSGAIIPKKYDYEG